MIDVGHMNFFNVDRCGLYRLGSEETFGCELSETFELIKDWVKDRPFSSTIPWDPATSKSNKPKAFCRDMCKDEGSGDYFLVLWKSDPGGTEGLLGVPEDDANGRGEIVKHSGAHNGRKVIWGRPCYYWIISDKNIVVSIKFDHSVCDAQLFQDYIVSCINNRVRHPNRVREYTDSGYVRISYVGEESNRYRYSFSMSLKSLNTSDIEMQDLSRRVTHIVRRETIKVDTKDERAEWVSKFTELVPFVAAKPKSKTRRIEVRAEAKPTVSEIKEIIEKNAHESRGGDGWDNVGFDTDRGVTWVDSYRLRDTINLSGRKGNAISAKQLSQSIAKHRHRYMKKLEVSLSETGGLKVAEK
ncbi:hypothetical protein DFO67_10684 [Modicisalibacter xianhensis]|uniref:Uncharacterized protein n=1 Tax=Modicisalibacter xianhensis TaxID=442341 RepID=A0A4R8G3Z6_9GAMM|nr:hypothetical protein [Halomonas xianhensis]TDX29846.1 hypothetical protein DFO67_10684 [Halomonas xianhensis]